MSDKMINLVNTVDIKIFSLALQIIVSGVVLLWAKDFTNKIFGFIKVRMGDFGRGTRVKIVGREGYISKVGFREVEIILNPKELLLIPIDQFISCDKIIVTSDKRNG